MNKQRLIDAEDVIWTFLNSYGYVHINEDLMKLVYDYLDKYPNPIEDEENE